MKNTLRATTATISRKLKEAALAWQLERRWSKDRILTAYLNTVFFGNGAYGVQMAARVYFDKKARDLTLPEAALLAGIPPTRPLRPRDVPAAARAAHDGAGAHARPGWITPTSRPRPTSARSRRRRRPPARGGGPAPYFVEYVKQQLIDHYGSARFRRRAARDTTIDLELQRRARAREQWLGEPDVPSAALVAIDPRDGRVLAMYGGYELQREPVQPRRPGRAPARLVVQAVRARRGAHQGISPETTFTSAAAAHHARRQALVGHNYEGSYLGRINLYDATTHSDNAVYAQLTALVGPKNVTTMAHRLGITSRLNDYFGIGLGVEAVNPLEMARAFPRSRTTATASTGGSSATGRAPSSRSSATTKRERRQVQQEVLDSNRTTTPHVDACRTWSTRGRASARRSTTGRPPARRGRPRTTATRGSLGYTPQLAVAVWVGYPKKLIPMTNQFEGGPVAGGTFPALIWKTFVTRALRHMDEPPENFEVPSLRAGQPGAGRPTATTSGSWTTATAATRARCSTSPDSRRGRTAQCKVQRGGLHVVGASLKNAETRLIGMPLTPDVITRPAKPGERLGIVVAQFPKSGTLSTWDTVRIVVAKATHGKVPDLVGLTLVEARTKLLKRGLVPVIESGTSRSDESVVRAQFPRAGVAAGEGLEVRLRVGAALASCVPAGSGTSSPRARNATGRPRLA